MKIDDPAPLIPPVDEEPMPQDQTEFTAVDAIRLRGRLHSQLEKAVPTRVTHMKHGDTTICGAAKVRGNSFYEWAYVNCHECRAQLQEKGTTP